MKSKGTFVESTELWKSNLWAIQFSLGSVPFPAEMKTKGCHHSSAGEKEVKRLGAAGTVCPSSMEMKTTLPVLYTPPYGFIQLPGGLNEQNQESFQTEVNRPGRDKLNWSPCHRSLSLTASCHSNKLDCCRMRPINCDVRRPCQVPCARCNCEHQWFLGFAGAFYQNAILYSASFLLICKCLLRQNVKAFSCEKRVRTYFGTAVFFFLTKWQHAKSMLRANSTRTTQPL